MNDLSFDTKVFLFCLVVMFILGGVLGWAVIELFLYILSII